MHILELTQDITYLDKILYLKKGGDGGRYFKIVDYSAKSIFPFIAVQ